ncbi:MAG: glycosyltransferase family 8 protein [Bryobacteraceae bacterium]
MSRNTLNSPGRGALKISERGPIVVACDAAYVMPLTTTLRSLAETNAGAAPQEVYVLSDGFPEALRKRVETSLPPGSVSIHWVKADLTEFKEFALAPHLSSMAYARFQIPYFIPQEVRRVLYLDVDILVLKDLSPLWQMDLNGAVLGAVADSFLPIWKTRCPHPEAIPEVPEYFNSGVLLMDMERWRTERISEKSLAYLQANPDTPFSDQDALNVVCDGRWKELGTEWNYQDHFELQLAKFDAAKRPGIVHFITSDKPWKAVVAHPSAQFYDQFRKRTRFARSFLQQFDDVLSGAWPATRAQVRRIGFLKHIRNSWKASQSS